MRVFRDVDEFYKARSGIVHKRNRNKQQSAEAKNEAFRKGFEVARRSVVKLLQDGSPKDWNEMVIGVTEPAC